MIEIYTDGSSKGNPGLGGWATVVYKDGEYITHRAQYEDYVTNNRMELKGLLCALLFANEIKDEEIIIYSDSAYCVNALNGWILGWKKLNWNRSKGELKNKDLFQQLYNLYWDEESGTPMRKENIIITKVSGHAGVIGNEFADALCSDNKEKINKIKASIS